MRPTPDSGSVVDSQRDRVQNPVLNAGHQSDQLLQAWKINALCDVGGTPLAKSQGLSWERVSYGPEQRIPSQVPPPTATGEAHDFDKGVALSRDSSARMFRG